MRGLGDLWSKITGRTDRDGEIGSDGDGDKAVPNESGIIEFRYRFRGSIGGNSYKYEIKNGKLGMDFMEKSDYGELSGEIPEGFTEELEKLCGACRVERWNGFDKTDTRVLDGSGFSLWIKYADGKTVDADGSNSFPAGYRDFKEKLDGLFSGPKEALFEEARQKKITEGLEGDPQVILATFKQKGASGSDDYHVLFSKEGIRSSNFELRVNAPSREFFDEPEFSYYCTVPDEIMDMRGFGDVVREYGLINWYDYHETAKDPNNSEWFQLSFSYENGRLNAMGTGHPERYDEARKAFLTHVARITASAKEKGFLKTDG